jgi:cytochrome c553
MRVKMWLGAAFGCAILGVLAAAPRSAEAVDAGVTLSCGTTDVPCPLQKWMRANMGAPLAAGDTDSLGKAFDRVPTFSPDASWAAWAQSASAGSTAARNKDMAGVKAACKSCHDAFKDKYKAQFRTRPVG